MKLAIDFKVDKKASKIIIIREFAANLPLVWDTWTISELLDQWWAPKPWLSKTKTMDFKNGGHRLYAMCGPDGEEHWGLTKYKTINIHRDFEGSDCFSDAGGSINESLPVCDFVVAFEGKGKHTLVTNTAVYQNLAQLEATISMGFKEGMTMALEGLDELLKRSKK